jgi:hypothetical protein
MRGQLSRKNFRVAVAFEGDVLRAHADVEAVEARHLMRLAVNAHGAASRAGVDDAELAAFEEELPAGLRIVLELHRAARRLDAGEGHAIEIRERPGQLAVSHDLLDHERATQFLAAHGGDVLGPRRGLRLERLFHVV